MFTELTQSGARINISDASCPERIVTVAGTTQQIVDAFSMICRRFEEVSFYKSFRLFENRFLILVSCSNVLSQAALDVSAV